MMDMALDKLSIKNMEKKTSETFKEYAHRWRDLAAQVQPLLIEKETTVLFFNTLKALYYDKMVDNASKNFANMVISGEMIASVVKNDKIENG